MISNTLVATTVFSIVFQLLLPSVDSLQIWSDTGDLPTSIPASCRQALSYNITCSELVSPYIVSSGRALDNYTAQGFCTSDCYTSLNTFKANVGTQCGNTLYPLNGNSTIMRSGSSVADPLVWAYNVTCINDSTGFCLADLYNGTKTACSDCSLKYGAAMLSSDYGRVKINPQAFSSLLSSCSVPASQYTYTYTLTTTTSATTAPSGPTPTCTGTNYTVSSSDTCQSISNAKSIAIDRLITANRLDYNCSTLVEGVQLCLADPCALQTVQANQTCMDIIGSQAFSSLQLVSWNPTIHTNCDNLDSMVGRSICVSPPGSANYSASPLNVTTATISSMFTGPWITGTPTIAPNFTTSWYNTQTTFPDGPTMTITGNATAASLVAQRNIYCPISPQNVLDGITEADLPDPCYDLVYPYCNPDPDGPIPSSTVFPASCTPLQETASTSTQSTSTSATSPAGPSPTQSGIVSTCTKYYQAISGDTCDVIATRYGNFSTTDFENWNPAVGSTCNALFLGYYYCVEAPKPTSQPAGSATTPTPTTSTTNAPASPSPTQPGIIASCTKYYQAVSGDTCDVIATKYGTFSATDFENWNPAVGSTCNALFLGYYYCVGVSGSPPTATAPTTPQPQQPGTVSNCKTFYQVKAGDGCAAIEASQGVTAANFAAWNTGIKSDCSNLWVGYYICVGA